MRGWARRFVLGWPVVTACWQNSSVHEPQCTGTNSATARSKPFFSFGYFQAVSPESLDLWQHGKNIPWSLVRSNGQLAKLRAHWCGSKYQIAASAVFIYSEYSSSQRTDYQVDSIQMIWVRGKMDKLDWGTRNSWLNCKFHFIYF